MAAVMQGCCGHYDGIIKKKLAAVLAVNNGKVSIDAQMFMTYLLIKIKPNILYLWHIYAVVKQNWLKSKDNCKQPNTMHH